MIHTLSPHRRLLWVVALLSLCGLCLLSAGCGTDANVDTRDKGDAQAIINMPDRFPNVAVKCYRGNGIYTSNDTSSPFVVQRDQVCNHPGQ